MPLDAAACYRALETRDARFDGQFFTGVRTTKVFCRPVCPALTPKRENCEFYASAAAALQAGYRPCLRCRPETSPPWAGTSRTVARAMGLIAEGALDQGSIDALAGRLGVGERHLRRLFHQQLGAAPLAVAQARRVLFAKQLIGETSLPLTDIAFAAGFSSVRRFNGAIRAAYDRAPRELRRQGAGAAALAVRLAYQPPYDWDGLIGFLAPRALPGVEEITSGRYARRIRGGRVEVTPGPGHLVARIEIGDVARLRETVERLNRLFDVHAPSGTIAEQLAAAGLPVTPGIRVPGAWDGFELAVRAILGQQVSVKAATTLAGRIVERHGGGLFPAAAALANADLEMTGVTSARAETIRELARACGDGRLPSQDALRRMKGIGEWTAQYISMRALNEPDAFPAGDFGLKKATGAATNAELEKMSLAWRPWRAYAAMSLWRRLA